MKRPFVSYVIVLLLCGIAVGTGAMYFAVTGELAEVREVGGQLLIEQRLMRQDLQGISEALPRGAAFEQCEWSSGEWTQTEKRPPQASSCSYDIFERKLRQKTCVDSGTNQQTRQFNQVTQDWIKIGVGGNPPPCQGPRR